MFGKRRAESVDHTDGKFSGLQVRQKEGYAMQKFESKRQIERPKERFHMRSLRALRIVGIGLAFAAILATGGLPVWSKTDRKDNRLSWYLLLFVSAGLGAQQSP